jgi:hypothetical protein
MEQKIKIQFGNLKSEIKSNFYLGGNERFCEGKTLDVIINLIPTLEGFEFNNYVKVPNNDHPYINRLVNINYFESIEIINNNKKNE